MKERLVDVLLIALPQNLPPGHEQQGPRPAIVVGLPHQLGKPRYPMLLVDHAGRNVGKRESLPLPHYSRRNCGT